MDKIQGRQRGTSATHGDAEVTTLPARRGARQIAGAMLAEAEPWPLNGACPVRDVLDRVGDTWSVLIVLRLGLGTLRFRELLRAVEGISQRMLTVTLRALEREGLVERRVYDTRPVSVDYRLTPLGESLLEPIEQVAQWAVRNESAVRTARERFDQAQAAAVAPEPGRHVHRVGGARAKS